MAVYTPLCVLVPESLHQLVAADTMLLVKDSEKQRCSLPNQLCASSSRYGRSSLLISLSLIAIQAN